MAGAELIKNLLQHGYRGSKDLSHPGWDVKQPANKLVPIWMGSMGCWQHKQRISFLLTPYILNCYYKCWCRIKILFFWYLLVLISVIIVKTNTSVLVDFYLINWFKNSRQCKCHVFCPKLHQFFLWMLAPVISSPPWSSALQVLSHVFCLTRWPVIIVLGDCGQSSLPVVKLLLLLWLQCSVFLDTFNHK